ncbi:protein FAR-RED IMPAIRED RESPONSE 1-like [Chenopodium quinoa]|uniref:protein FAR-RED IMPAIRED RESPONSE 1-like n=1 Tax=Chenopodium quinoa TaxID=63459 RepID=UPI000B79301D|nr:protein FAR-RED IMPAIRED RESPONSE 1-like [Chenopodium quinoa]
MRNLAQSAGGIREIGFLKKDLYNTCEKFKREEIKDGDTKTVLAYLLGKTASDPSFFLRYTRDDHDGIDKMFWCDGICQAYYKAFGKVIGFDTTYKVNAYQKPFVVVVGVNHHRKTVPLGVALIANETTDTYIWVLEQLKEAGGNVAPYTFITDGDKAMAAAITEVFPRAHHRLCLCHLMRNIKGHTNKRFCSGFMKCVDGARTQAEFEEAWEDLMKAYVALRDKKWAQDLYKDKEKWAEAFMVGQFYAGMRSTQRCESMNSTLKTVITSKIMLYRFVELYDQVLEHIRFEEDKDDYISTHTFPVITGVLPEIKTQAARTYTWNMYKLFLKELNFESGHIMTKTKEEKGHRDGASTTFWLNDCVNKDCNYVVCYNKKLQQMVCCCMKYNSIGLPCRHMFAVMKFTGMVEIPSGCILRRWTIRDKVHVKNTFKDHDFQKRNDHASANGRYAFLTGLSAQLCRMVSSSYDRSTWVRDKLAKMLLEIENEKINPKDKDIIKDQKVKKGKSRGRPKKSEVKTTGNENIDQGVPFIGHDVHDITHVVRNVAATSETNPSPVKSGGFVELLKNFLPRTYNTGD